MKILLDTNIIIHREWQNIKHSQIWQLFFYIDKFKHDKFVHKISIDEIQKYWDKKALEIILQKVQNYQIADTLAPDLNKKLAGIAIKNDKNENDKNDTLLLNEVLHWKFDIFITEDKLIHEKAKQLNAENKVYTIENYLEEVFIDNPWLINYDILSIKKEKFWSPWININDVFFESLKNDYKWFEEWYYKKSEEFVYIYKYNTWVKNNEIWGLLYIKIEWTEELYSDIIPSFDRKKRLKIWTFKVSLNGLKIWERFIKIIFDNALVNWVDEIYVTIFDKTQEQLMLINLLEEFWFQLHWTKNSPDWIEKVYVRKLNKVINEEAPIKSYPYISGKNNIFLIPIKPEYHTWLFPDSILKNEDFEDFSIDKPYQNSIKKTYISWGFWQLRKQMKKWDILVFYRMWVFNKMHTSTLTTIWLISSVNLNIDNKEHLLELCKKRTILNNKELENLWIQHRGKSFLINFLYIDSLKSKIILKRMLEEGIINNFEDLRGCKLTKEQFNKIITIWNGNKSIIID